MTQDGKYQKQSLIGSGERVEVYLGLNTAFGRKVAIKELRGGSEVSIVERNSFFVEYEKWARFENTRLARIEDIDRTRAWVIQEFMPQSITEYADNFYGNNAATYSVFEQLLEGLSFLHSQGVIHCNMKSSNVRVANETIKLCDGRCVAIGFPGSLPRPRGSNRYLAPEMINEEFGKVGTASDIYVAGIIMLEALAGAEFDNLFKGYVSGTPDKEMGWVRWHNSPETLAPVHELLPVLPKEFAELLDGMVCKNVATRFSNADHLLTELRSRREAIINGTGEKPKSPDTPAPRRPAAPAVPSADDSKSKFKLIDRPSSASYVRCLSGSSAGSIFPTTMDTILVGDTSRCNVRLSSDQYPSINGREVQISLGNNGWQIGDLQNHPVVVDSKTSFESAPIRSGSIFRLSPKGPDFQFVVQGEHDWTWQDIAAQLELTQAETHSVPSRLLESAKKKEGATAASPAPASAAPSRPQPPTGKTKGGPQAPKPPKAPKQTAGKSSAANAPARPSQPAGHGDNASTKISMMEKFQSMDKNKRNNLILFVSLPVLALLIILFMPRAKPKPDNKEKKEGESPAVVEKTEGDNATPTPTATDAPKPADEKPADDKQANDKPAIDSPADVKRMKQGPADDPFDN